MSDIPDLLSVVIGLRALEAHPRPPRWWGPAVHYMALQIFKQYDPGLEKQLHKPSELRPFTVSSLLGQPAEGPLDPDHLVAIRLTALQQPLTSILQQAVDGSGPLAPGTRLELDRIPFQVEGSAPASFSDWNRSGEYSTLAGRYLLVQNPPPSEISLHFASPVGFKSGGKQFSIPTPELVFGSLLRRWNAFSLQSFSKELRLYVAKNLAIERYDLHSRSLPGKEDSLLFGGLGYMTYTTLVYDRYWMSLLHTLADYALYAGVGRGSSMGQGQCQNLNN
jgi:CRISPR-associated endoribonuclease Cas6